MKHGQGWEAETLGQGITTNWSSDMWIDWMEKYGYQVSKKAGESYKDTSIGGQGYGGKETIGEFIQYLFDSNQIQQKMYDELRGMNLIHKEGIIVRKQ